jgi:hypothetical protein
MRTWVLSIVIVLLAARVAAQAPTEKTSGQIDTTISGKLLFVGEAPAVDTGDKVVMLVMPRFYYSSYSKLFEAGTEARVSGREFVSTALLDQDKEIYMVVEAITIAGKTFTIFRVPVAGQIDDARPRPASVQQAASPPAGESGRPGRDGGNGRPGHGGGTGGPSQGPARGQGPRG